MNESFGPDTAHRVAFGDTPVTGAVRERRVARRRLCVMVEGMNRSFLLLSLLFTAACSSSSPDNGQPLTQCTF